jgi:hypothetical protein
MAVKKDDAPAASHEVVVVSFAHAKTKAGEVVMLAKNDLVTDRFVEGREGEPFTLAHLRSIGFIGKQD